MTTSTRSLCVVVHDVAPATWDPCRRLLDTLAQHGIERVTLLAVPRYHRQSRDSGFERWLSDRAASDDEVVLHGFYHLDGGTPRGPIDSLMRRVYTRGEGEFRGLSFDAATRRMQEGRRWLAELGITAAGFVAPAWLLGADAWRALRSQPFDYTCTLRRIQLLGEGEADRSIVCQSQVYSSSTTWRQLLSVAWNETLAALQRNQEVVRLELHPSDEAALVRRSWERLLDAQAGTREVRTLGDVARLLRTSPATARR
jgi:predicted deacetylase